VDVESFGRFAAANARSPYVTADQTLYQPPIKTITWSHTGVALGRERILTQLAGEYFPHSAARLRGTPAIDAAFAEKSLPEPDLGADDLTAAEWREALRACKGMTLRQEIYELDVVELERSGAHVPVRLFSAAAHNCNVRRLQPRGANRHAVFLVTESEALTYHYELDLRSSSAGTPLAPDPRIAHTLNLSFDDLGNVIQSVAVGYPRTRAHQDAALDAGQIGLVRDVQSELHLAYTETSYTNDVPANLLQAAPTDDYRLRVPYEVKTFELTGFAPAGGRYFDLAELRGYRLSDSPIPGQGVRPVVSKPYHDLTRGPPTRRLVEHAHALFFRDDLAGALPLGTLGRLGIPHERYKLALTDDLLNAIFTAGRLAQTVPAGGGSARDVLADARASGYLGGAAAATAFGPQAVGQYWMRSGVAVFEPNADRRFYLPERYVDPFQQEVTLAYDTKYTHFIEATRDARGNTTSVVRFDYRVLAPVELQDANANLTEVRFDALGRVIALAVKGKGTEADDLQGYDEALANPELAETLRYFDLPQLTEAQARALFAPILGKATTRFLYHFGETRNTTGSTLWRTRPAGTCAVMRERHAATIAAGGTPSPLQIAFECSDGGGGVLLRRAQAEPAQPGGPLRWIVSGKTVVNNKGKPVKQYEPYFSGAASCRGEDDVQEEVGVTPVLFYDASGRLVRTEMPDGTFSRVEFSPWHVTTYDASDTAYDPDPGKRSDWYDRRTNPAHPRYAEFNDPDELWAAQSSQMHANTPVRTIVDSLGRNVVRVEHNRYADSPGVIRDERYLTFTRLDAEGKPLWIRDARGNLVMQYVGPARPNDDPGDAIPNDLVPCYDIAGNLLYQHGMDAGDRWTLMDAAGQPMLAWDFNTRTLDDGSTVAESRRFQTRYDDLHRPIEQWLAINAGAASLLEAFSYTDTDTFRSAAGVVDQAALDTARARNLIGQTTRHYDPSGLATVERVDFKGAAEEITRTLVKDVVAAVVDWNVANRATLLETETFIQITEHDALGRTTALYNWHRDKAGQPGNSDRVAVYVPAYNSRGALESETLHVRARKQPGAGGRASFQPDADARRNVQAIAGATWNAKGQKLTLSLGNGTTTRYDYDPESFRLRHLYTRRGAGFAGDCAGDPDAARPVRPCGAQNLHYTYDPSGNVTHVQDDAQPTIWFANQQVEPSSDFTYDALYRLIEATGRENDAAIGAPPHAEGNWPTGQFPSGAATRNYTQRYRYDRVGNFLSVRHVAPGLPSQSDGGWTREYDYAFSDPNQAASNRLWQTWLGGDRSQAITYRPDDHGNMLNVDQTAPGLDVRWDWRDMIRALDLVGGGDAFYNYDSGKQRTRKRLERNGGGREDRIYLGGYELYRRRNAAGTIVEEIESHHLFEGEQRVLLVDDVLRARANAQPGPNGLRVSEQTLFRYQYGNHLGSVSLELDADARVISYEEYHPYGTSAFRLLDAALEAPAKRYRYTGMERDEESGLNYHGARYCAPWLARWCSTDPAGLVDGTNLFGYVGGNPLSYVDAGGREKKKAAKEPEEPENINTPKDFEKFRTGAGKDNPIWNDMGYGGVDPAGGEMKNDPRREDAKVYFMPKGELGIKSTAPGRTVPYISAQPKTIDGNSYIIHYNAYTIPVVVFHSNAAADMNVILAHEQLHVLHFRAAREANLSIAAQNKALLGGGKDLLGQVGFTKEKQEALVSQAMIIEFNADVSKVANSEALAYSQVFAQTYDPKHPELALKWVRGITAPSAKVTFWSADDKAQALAIQTIVGVASTREELKALKASLKKSFEPAESAPVPQAEKFLAQINTEIDKRLAALPAPQNKKPSHNKKKK
jgi:RHS repeat-associated protein